MNGLGTGNAGYLNNTKDNRDDLDTAIGNELNILLITKHFIL